MNHGQRARRHNQAAIRGARECRDGTLDLAGSRTLTGLTSTPTDGATDWITAHWPIPETIAGSRRTAARVTPARAKLSTKPEPSGSATFTNTIGTVRASHRRVTPGGSAETARRSGGGSQIRWHDRTNCHQSLRSSNQTAGSGKGLFLLQVKGGRWTTLLSPPGFQTR